MKVYTRKGDKGFSSLIGDTRRKDDLRFNAYGTTDEALSYVGLLYEKIDDILIKEQLEFIMNLLFMIGSDLANVKNIEYYVKEKYCVIIEGYIDLLDLSLRPLETFILPIGCLAFNYTNLARTCLRRAERIIVTLNNDEAINENIIPLVNRLSDYFFTLGRYINFIEGIDDTSVNFNI